MMLDPNDIPPYEETMDLIAESLQPTTALPISEAAALAAMSEETGVSTTLPVTPAVEKPTEPPPAWLPRFRRGR